MSGIEAGWHPDPTGRHQHRWWNGSAWTDQVAEHTNDPVIFADSFGIDTDPDEPR